MAILNQKKILNVIPGITPQLTVHCSQSDEGSTVEFDLFAGSVPFEPDGTASVQGIRKDGTGFGPEAVTLDGNTATVTLSTAMTGAAGPALCEITITETGGSVSTANFALLVEEAAFPNRPLVDNSVDVYQQILQYVQSFPAAAAADATAKVAAEATARAAADQALQSQITANTSAIAAEASARTSADGLLQAEIDQIIAPTGEAPSAAEVQNARIGVDGTVYDTLGNAIRGQVGGLKSALTSITGNTVIEGWVNQKYIDTSGATVDVNTLVSSTGYECLVTDCSQGDIFTIIGEGTVAPRLWCFIDSSGNSLSASPTNTASPSVGLILTAPANATKLVVNSKIDVPHTLISGYGLEKRIGEFGNFGKIVIIKGALAEKNKYVNATTGEIASNTSSAPYAISGIPVKLDYVQIVLNSCPVAGVRGIAFYDALNNYISGKKYTEGVTDYVLDIPSNAKTMALTTFGTEDTFALSFGKYNIPQSILNGKNVTVIGDSITEHNYRAVTNWAMWLSQWTGAIVQNLGISGSGFIRTSPYINRIPSIQESPDIIGIAMSWNDLSDSVGLPVGTATDTGEDSIAGYVNDFFTALLTAYPTTPVIAYIQSPWGIYKPGETDSDEYIRVMTELLALRGIPFYKDMYYGSALHPWDASNRTVYYTCDDDSSAHYGESDSIHPNSNGHMVIARHFYHIFIENVLESGLGY